VAELVRGLTADRVRANLAEVRDEVAQAAGGRPVEILAAVKYVPVEDLGELADAGLTLLGENRAQELERKVAALEGRSEVTWDFIGQLQSRKVKVVAPLVRRIHSLGSDSAREALARLDTGAEVYVQVNIAGEEGKAGIAPDDLARFLDATTPRPVGLTVMPPLAHDPEDSRRWFAAARELADGHGLPGLSMGTTQDFPVAVQEGATCVRIGSRLYR
jgi:PLP dependent protein